jgi:hypothetical protein
MLSFNQISHRKYLQSLKWQEIRAAALNHYGKTCSKCGEFGTDVHHLRYPSVQGEEGMEDLEVLCRDCHEAIHGIQRGNGSCEAVHVQSLYNYLTEKHKKIIAEKLNIPVSFIFMCDSLEGKKARNMALKMLNVGSYYGLYETKENEKYLTKKESSSLKLNQKRKDTKSQKSLEKARIQNNPRLYRKLSNEEKKN